MPMYVYECGKGHVHEEVRKIEDRDKPLFCHECKRPLMRVYTPFNLVGMPTRGPKNEETER